MYCFLMELFLISRDLSQLYAIVRNWCMWFESSDIAEQCHPRHCLFYECMTWNVDTFYAFILPPPPRKHEYAHLVTVLSFNILYHLFFIIIIQYYHSILYTFRLPFCLCKLDLEAFN